MLTIKGDILKPAMTNTEASIYVKRQQKAKGYQKKPGVRAPAFLSKVRDYDFSK